MTGIGNGPKIVFEIGGLRFTETVVMGWLIIVAVLILCLWLTHDLKKVPEKKRQVVAEMLVNFVNNMVKENMGVKMMKYAPYIATLLIYAVFGALISMIGLRSMTADINVTATWALMTFVLITYNKIKANGFKGYLKSFAQPVAFILPLNIISEVATPASISGRYTCGAQRVFRPVLRVHTGLYLLNAHHGKRWCGGRNRVNYRFCGKYKKVNSK